MRHCSCIVLTLLAGCATVEAPVTPSLRLQPPPAWTLVVSPDLPDPAPGENAKELLSQCRAAYASATDKLPPLQSFAKRVTRKP
jgi:hypothetical protein